MMRDTNSKLSMHVSDGAVMTSHVTRHPTPDPRASGVGAWISEFGVRRSSTFSRGVVVSARPEGWSRRPRFLAIRPLQDDDGDLDAKIGSLCRAGIARGNKSAIAARTDTLAYGMSRRAGRLPLRMRLCHTGLGFVTAPMAIGEISPRHRVVEQESTRTTTSTNSCGRDAGGDGLRPRLRVHPGVRRGRGSSHRHTNGTMAMAHQLGAEPGHRYRLQGRGGHDPRRGTERTLDGHNLPE